MLDKILAQFSNVVHVNVVILKSVYHKTDFSAQISGFIQPIKLTLHN